MRSTHSAQPAPVPTEHHHAGERIKEFVDHLMQPLHHTREGAANHEPTVEEIVDQVVALHRGQAYDVLLDPHVTRIDNLEWLLPICVEQFGRTIDMDERREGEKLVLTITVTGEQSVN